MAPCPACHMAHHKDCWEYNCGCGVYGCTQAAETEKLQEMEIPASYWGRTDKQCPNCAKMIQAAAMRCIHCKTTFSTARPQESGEFQADRAVKDGAGSVRNTAVWLMVLAVIPFTAPIAAIYGVYWYLTRRKQIAALPSVRAAIAKLAIAIACVETSFLIVVGIGYALFA